jgi:hypothetical protein
VESLFAKIEYKGLEATLLPRGCFCGFLAVLQPSDLGSWWGSALEVSRQQSFQADRQGLRSLMGGVLMGGMVWPPASEKSVQVESFEWMLIAALP